MRRPHDHADFVSSRPSEPVEGFGLWGQQESVRTPNVQTPAPSAPGSESSELAAKAIDGPFRRKSWRVLMLVLASTDRLMSMYELHERTGLAINVVCARIPELEPMWIQRQKGACESRVKANLRVDGFTLTDAGRARVKGAA